MLIQAINGRPVSTHEEVKAGISSAPRRFVMEVECWEEPPYLPQQSNSLAVLAYMDANFARAV